MPAMKSIDGFVKFVPARFLRDAALFDHPRPKCSLWTCAGQIQYPIPRTIGERNRNQNLIGRRRLYDGP